MIITCFNETVHEQCRLIPESQSSSDHDYKAIFSSTVEAYLLTNLI